MLEDTILIKGVDKMKSLKGTKTAENLLKAFAGESQARNRYTFFASVADKEGYKQIRNIFIETADNEKEHAKRFYKLLVEGFKDELPANITINADYPVEFGDTAANLKAAADGENDEWSHLYPEFAKVAKEEGFNEVAVAFSKIADAETNHEKRFLKLLANIENGTVFKKTERFSGNAETADIFMKATQLLKFVLHVSIRRHILSFM